MHKPVIWGHWCQNQESQVRISNCIPQWSVGCNYVYLPEIPASGIKVLIQPRQNKAQQNHTPILWDIPVHCIWPFTRYPWYQYHRRSYIINSHKIIFKYRACLTLVNVNEYGYQIWPLSTFVSWAGRCKNPTTFSKCSTKPRPIIPIEHYDGVTWASPAALSD